MLQKTSLEFVLTEEEADRYNRAIHRVLHVMTELPPLTMSAYNLTVLRADLRKLATALDNGTPLMTFGPAPDPFVPEGDGSARDVLLGRLVENQRLVIDYLRGCTLYPKEREKWEDAAAALIAAWGEYEDLGRG
jgi:hypothetical protein